MKKKTTKGKSPRPKKVAATGYHTVLTGVVHLLTAARHAAARSVNSIITATYWDIGRRIVEQEQGGRQRAGYGEELIERLSADLTTRFGRGFSRPNLQLMRQFYLSFPSSIIRQTPSSKSAVTGVNPIRQTLSGNSAPAGRLGAGSDIRQTPSAKFSPLHLKEIARAFPLPWSHYVLLIRHSRSPEAASFYHAEALRGGWSVRQLDRQIQSQFYERAALSRNKTAVMKKGAASIPTDAVTAEEEIKNPLVLEFLGLKDEYSENDLEEALIHRLETFLLELGNDFAFVGRQRRLRIDDEWFRVDLLLFHRRLRCLVIVDLKLGRFTHADAGQMNVYLNYAKEHWTQPGENPPVGIILCAGKGAALAHYALEGMSNKPLIREYQTALPNEKVLAAEIDKSRRMLERRK